jgi:hypothetical protein
MKKPMKKPSSQSDELHKNLGIPAYKKLEHDDGVNKKEMPKKGGKGKCDCKK